ncbi:hypothetical protein LINGRAHAP2_LOCUS7852, partial [Linum grandiflorum]
VAWKTIVVPKTEAWVKIYRIKSATIWSCPPAAYHSWTWQRILKARDYDIQHVSQAMDGSLLWQGCPMGRFSVSQVWDTIRPKYSKVPWYGLIWQPPSIPKHSCIAWMAVNRKLTTNAQMAAWGLSLDISCYLCQL